MRYVILLAATGAALAPPHASRRRGVALRALAADALETKRLQCFSAFDESETRLAMRLIAAAESDCLLYTSPSPRDKRQSRMPSSA